MCELTGREGREGEGVTQRARSASFLVLMEKKTQKGIGVGEMPTGSNER